MCHETKLSLFLQFLFPKVKGKVNVDDANNFRVESQKLQKERLTYDYEFIREISQRFELHPGTYCVIPATFFPDDEAAFLLRLAAETPIESKWDIVIITVLCTLLENITKLKYSDVLVADLSKK